MIPALINDSTLASALYNRVQTRLEKGCRVAVSVGRGSSPALTADVIHTLLSLPGLTLHAVGSAEDLPAEGGRMTVHEADSSRARRDILHNLTTSGGVDALLVLPDAKSEEPDWQALTGTDRAAMGLTLSHPAKLGRLLALGDTEGPHELDVDAGVARVDLALPLLRALGMIPPRVAALAAVEVPNPGLPVTMWGDELAKRFTDRNDVFVQGPLSMDLAVSTHAAAKKKAAGEVPGKADLLLAQSVTVARGVRDALAHGAGEDTATVILGLPLPVAAPARGTGVTGAVASVLLALTSPA